MSSPLRLAGLLLLASLSTMPASSEEAGRQSLTFSPWTKFCLNELCFTGSDMRLNCRPVAAAVLIEKAGDPKKTLRVTLPTAVDRDRGAGVAIDQMQPITRPFTQCFANGCMADYEAGSELIEQLKHGEQLRISGFDQSGAPLNFSLPLAGFAEAYDGPAQQPKVFEESQRRLREDLKRREQADAERGVSCWPN